MPSLLQTCLALVHENNMCFTSSGPNHFEPFQWKNTTTRGHFMPRLKCRQKSGTDASSTCMASLPTPGANLSCTILSTGEAYHPCCTGKT
jgi:hypothetical protein